MLGRLRAFDVSVFFTDGWEAYAELIPGELLVQTKAETHGVERNNFRQRHWLVVFAERLA
jgi:IS1 family transposase